MDLDYYINEIIKWRASRGPPLTDEDTIYNLALLTEEVGELAESITKDFPIENIKEEIADVFVTFVIVAQCKGINLNEAFIKKLIILDNKCKLKGE